MDFSRAKLSGRMYGGSEKKLGVLMNGQAYMLKFQKNTPFGKRNNHISEYIGSHIFEIAGIKAHRTILGTYRGEQVVACKDFNVAGVMFVPFNDVGESTLEQDKERYSYTYDDIMQMLRDNSRLIDVEGTIDAFWEIFIVDALTGNFDRHGSNWGFLKHNGQYEIAPVFDNGSCLFPNMIDEDEMRMVIASEEETRKRVYMFPTSQIRINGKKSSYYDVISSLQYDECNKALERIYERLDVDKIYELIDNTEFITDTQKDFYKHMMRSRYELIIRESIRRLHE